MYATISKLLAAVYRKFRSTWNRLFQTPGFYTEYYYEKEIESTNTAFEGAEIDFSFIGNEDLSQLREIWPIDIKRVSKRFDRGDLCCLGMINGKPVSYFWIQVRDKHYSLPNRRWIQIKKGEGMIFHVRVRDGFMGMGIARKCYTWLFTELKRIGINRILVYTDSNNDAHKRLLDKLGFIIYMRWSYFNWPGILHFNTWKG